jgi:hypothetical protein
LRTRAAHHRACGRRDDLADEPLRRGINRARMFNPAPVFAASAQVIDAACACTTETGVDRGADRCLSFLISWPFTRLAD